MECSRSAVTGRPPFGIAAGCSSGHVPGCALLHAHRIDVAHRYILQTYARPDDMVLVSGEGCRLYDARGKSYLDFAAGIAVNALGEGRSASLVLAACLRRIEDGFAGPASDLVAAAHACHRFHSTPHHSRPHAAHHSGRQWMCADNRMSPCKFMCGS